MSHKMHDIIATSNRMGYPDVFLTMACNPNWPEIHRMGHIFCARVFSLKLKALMKSSSRTGILKKCFTHVRVIEF